ncbi:ABC-type transport system involved in cytochrome c biogenesis, permease component [Burkholderiales bacterium JOSHI_001]|nr:ABC-type transport system involved in cytochrome c biogenesis, permease component [Burkholderiales bacterium JOSHI_001]
MNPWHPLAPEELPWLWLGVALLMMGAGRAALGLLGGLRASAAPGPDLEPAARGGLRWLGAALLAVAVGLGLRWARLGHGPFIDMFEILASSLLSLGLVFSVGAVLRPELRRTAPLVLPLLALMGAWLLTTNPADTHFPATYDTPVLWVHVLLGKVFLGCALLATGLAGVLLLRRWALGRRAFARLPSDAQLDSLAWQWMLVALVFESLMLIAGAVWAQDAWGRWWAWDPLETWAFLTWLLLVAAVHTRLRGTLGPRAGAGLIVAVFVLAFLTFFGVPFVSAAPHKGAV